MGKSGLEGWKWWAWQIIVGGGMLWIFEIILNQIGMTMLHGNRV